MEEVYRLISETLQAKGKVVVGISGISLSGKTKIAYDIKDYLEEDNFKVKVTSLIEKEGIIEECLKDKNPSKYYYENAFDFLEVKKQIVNDLNNNNIVIVEGPLLFKNNINIDFDIKLWVDCTFTTSISRAEEHKKVLYEDLYMWLQKQHFSIDNPKCKVDFIIKNDEILENEPEVMVDIINTPESIKRMKWLYEPTVWNVVDKGLYVEADAITDFWQRTHYGFSNDNAHMFYLETEKDFIMTTKVEFNAINQFDQCGLAVRIDEDNWLKTSIEYELCNPPKLGAVVTNLGYSDWSTEELDFQVQEAEFRITREGQDYKIEVKIGDRKWRQLRVCHLHNKEKKVMCGVYCCSPIDNGYKVLFKDIKIIEQY